MLNSDRQPTPVGGQGLTAQIGCGLQANRLELIALAAMTLIFFGRFFAPGTIFLLRDMFLLHYPSHIVGAEMWRQGSVPLWTHYTGCGEPFLANIETAVLYPPNLLFLVLPVTAAMAVLVAGHTAMAVLAAYALCRRWEISPRGSLLAAVVIGFSTASVVWVEFFPGHCSLSWMPVVFLCYVQWLRLRRAGWIPLTGSAVGLQALAGYPEMALWTMAALGLYAVMVGAWEWKAHPRVLPAAYPVLAVAAVAVIGVLLAMGQLLPSWEAASLSGNRQGVVDPELHRGSVAPGMFLTLLHPFLYGVPGYLGRYWGPSCYEYWVGSFYIGLVPIALLGAALLQWLARCGGKPSEAVIAGSPSSCEGRRSNLSEQEKPTGSSALQAFSSPKDRRVAPFLPQNSGRPFLGSLRGTSVASDEAISRSESGRRDRWFFRLLPFRKIATSSRSPSGTPRDDKRSGSSTIRSGASLISALEMRSGEHPFPSWLRARTPFLVALLVLCVLYAMGRYTPFFPVLWRIIPPLQKFRWPAKAMLDAVFALGILSGLALDYLVLTARAGTAPGARRFFARWGMLIAGGLLSIFILACLADDERLGIDLLRRYLIPGNFNAAEWARVPWDIIAVHGVQLIFVGLAAGILISLRSAEGAIRPAALSLLILVAFADLLTTSRVLLPSGSADLLKREGPPLAGQSGVLPSARYVKLDEIGQWMYGESDRAIFRCAREGLGGRWAEVDHVFVFNPNGNFVPRDLWNAGTLLSDASAASTDARAQLLRDLNCGGAIAAPNVFGYYQGRPLEPPRLLALSSDPLPRAHTADKSDGREIRKLEYGPNSVSIALNSDRAGALVLADTWYPGWTATVNGRPAPIIKVAPLGRAVAVAAGENDVQMRFMPRSFVAGIAVSAATLLLLLAYALWTWRAGKTSSCQTPGV